MNNRYCNFEQYSGFLLILFICLTSFPFVSPTNLCSTTGLCCKHRDSECVAQRVYPNHTVDTSQLPCYCDHACIELEDCCPDYRQFCGVKDCHVSEWGPWSPCSVETCDDFGVEERHRVILGHPVNGGLKCPHLLQSKQCQALPCEKVKPFKAGSNHDESWREQENHHHHLQEEQNTFGGGNKGDEHNIVQSQQPKTQQKQSNQRERKNKHEQDNKNTEEVSKNKHEDDGEPFNKHYHSKQKHSNNKRRRVGQHSRQVWKEHSKEAFDGHRFSKELHDRKRLNDDGELSSNDKFLSVKKRKDKRRLSDRGKPDTAADEHEHGGCMEMVIVRASSGCHLHDKRLHLGTRICVECPATKNHHHHQSGNHKKTLPSTSPYHNLNRTSKRNAEKSGSSSSSCSSELLTEMPIRKFRINHTCHGKITFLTKKLSPECNCRKGLHYELI